MFGCAGWTRMMSANIPATRKAMKLVTMYMIPISLWSVVVSQVVTGANTDRSYDSGITCGAVTVAISGPLYFVGDGDGAGAAFAFWAATQASYWFWGRTRTSICIWAWPAPQSSAHSPWNTQPPVASSGWRSFPFGQLVSTLGSTLIQLWLV